MSGGPSALPRLAGPTVALVPVPHPVAVAVVQGLDPAAALARIGLHPGSGWPHADTCAALRPLAEHGQPGDEQGFLVVVQQVVVGECGALPTDVDGNRELAYGLAEPARRQGLGTEAVAVLAAWAERQPGVRSLSAAVLPGNEASLRLLARLGFRESGSHPPHLRLTRPAPGVRVVVKGRHVC